MPRFREPVWLTDYLMAAATALAPIDHHHRTQFQRHRPLFHCLARCHPEPLVHHRIMTRHSRQAVVCGTW